MIVRSGESKRIMRIREVASGDHVIDGVEEYEEYIAAPE
jgi:hypothetical protein